MRIIRPSSETEMIWEFLRMEMSSPRYETEISAALAKYSATAKLLLDADLSNDTENRLRREILGSFRGYGQNRLALRTLSAAGRLVPGFR
ncbi:MAG: hypothetical protein QM296_10935 [Bacillota bacterium]|nr:hypothetical protein [Bacillota bacterium]